MNNWYIVKNIENMNYIYINDNTNNSSYNNSSYNNSIDYSNSSTDNGNISIDNNNDNKNNICNINTRIWMFTYLFGHQLGRYVLTNTLSFYIIVVLVLYLLVVLFKYIISFIKGFIDRTDGGWILCVICINNLIYIILI
jgi:hypothetical protein